MIHAIRLQQFRSYIDETIEFAPGVNIIVGPNGCGKTNLLEALLVSCTGASYRVADGELIAFEKNWARIDTTLPAHTRTIKLQLQGLKTKKTYIFDDKQYKILTHQHRLPVVLFEPNNMQLLHAQPEARRQYLDDLLEQTQPQFASIRKQYRRVLTQRNKLLKTKQPTSAEQFFVWNLRLSELGGVLAKARTELISHMNEVLPGLYHRVAGNNKTITTIHYQSKLPISSYETTLLKSLEDNLVKDTLRGFTSYGPHRDDFMICFDGKPASTRASRGETRSALLALKVFELQLLESVLGIKPILLLDDVFSELDGRRRHALASFLQTHQTFITTTDADLVLNDQMAASNIIPI
jgi:DNA replication and repair protein RecF